MELPESTKITRGRSHEGPLSVSLGSGQMRAPDTLKTDLSHTNQYLKLHDKITRSQMQSVLKRCTYVCVAINYLRYVHIIRYTSIVYLVCEVFRVWVASRLPPTCLVAASAFDTSFSTRRLNGRLRSSTFLLFSSTSASHLSPSSVFCFFTPLSPSAPLPIAHTGFSHL